jgi:hypothetical protein
MGLILDSSVVIAAEGRGDRVDQLIEKIVKATGDREAALSAIGLTELIHGIYRAQTPEIGLRRESFLNELLEIRFAMNTHSDATVTNTRRCGRRVSLRKDAHANTKAIATADTTNG